MRSEERCPLITEKDLRGERDLYSSISLRAPRDAMRNLDLPSIPQRDKLQAISRPSPGTHFASRSGVGAYAQSIGSKDFRV